MKWSHQGRKGRGPTAGIRVKGSKSTCKLYRSEYCGRSARNWATWRGFVHIISPRARSVGCVGQLKRRVTVSSVAWESGPLCDVSSPRGA